MPACARKMSHCFREITSISKDVLYTEGQFKGCGGGLCQRAGVEQKLNDRHEMADHSLTLFKSQSNSYQLATPCHCHCPLLVRNLFSLAKSTHKVSKNFSQVSFQLPFLSVLYCVEKLSAGCCQEKNDSREGGGKNEICIFISSSKPSRSHCLPFQALPHLSLTVLENPTLSGFKAHRKNRQQPAAFCCMVQ